MNLQEEDKTIKEIDSSESESTGFTLRGISFRWACTCYIIFVLVYILWYNSPHQLYVKSYPITSFKKIEFPNPPCCENRYECWMQCLGREIAFTPLNRLVIPGTHNSGVYSAAFKARTSNSFNLADIVRDKTREQISKFLRWGIIG